MSYSTSFIHLKQQRKCEGEATESSKDLVHVHIPRISLPLLDREISLRVFVEVSNLKFPSVNKVRKPPSHISPLTSHTNGGYGHSPQRRVSRTGRYRLIPSPRAPPRSVCRFKNATGGGKVAFASCATQSPAWLHSSCLLILLHLLSEAVAQ